MNKLEPEPRKPAKPASGQTIYDAPFYKTLYNNSSVDQFMKYAVDLENYVKKQGWDLEIKFNKHYSEGELLV